MIVLSVFDIIFINLYIPILQYITISFINKRTKILRLQRQKIIYFFFKTTANQQADNSIKVNNKHITFACQFLSQFLLTNAAIPFSEIWTEIKIHYTLLISDEEKLDF